MTNPSGLHAKRLWKGLLNIWSIAVALIALLYIRTHWIHDYLILLARRLVSFAYIRGVETPYREAPP